MCPKSELQELPGKPCGLAQGGLAMPSCVCMLNLCKLMPKNCSAARMLPTLWAISQLSPTSPVLYVAG